MSSRLSTTGLPADAIKKIQRIFSEYPEIDQVSLYGSRAKGNFHSGSDIDLTIMSKTLDYSQLIKIENELDDLLLPYKIDLSIFRKIVNSDLVDHIQRVGIKIYHQ